MENNQNHQPPVEKNKNNQHAEGGAQGGRSNHHRHNRRHHRPKNEGEKKNPQGNSLDKAFFSPDGQQKDGAPAPRNEEKQNRQNQQKKNNKHRGGEGKIQQQKNDQKPEQGNNNAKNPSQGGKGQSQGGGKNKGKNRNQGKGNHRRGLEQRPYDPYEEVRPEELSLEELRARIVLKPSDVLSASVSDKDADACEPSDEALPDQSAVDAILNGETGAAPSEPEEKVEVIGVRFRSAGKTYYFDPQGIKGKKGEFAIVETARGAEFGEISLANTMVNVKDTVSPLRPVLRIATPEDIRHDEENREKEKKALVTCQERIAAHKLEMKLIDVQYAFDNSKLLFYFTADGRVDFRDLVKDLASTFRTRIELRQIGIRDEAKMLGGLGACGRPLCCSTFLPDFAQVSIKMAKDQNLSLNSSKISGVCGRLMCCLRYEADVYAEEIRLTPQNDTVVKTEDGIGTVISSNPLAGTIRVILKDSPDTPPKQYHRSAITVIGKGKRGTENKKEDDKEKKA